MSVRLTRRPLSLAAAYRALPGDACGGVALFVGRSRSDRGTKGRVRGLDYEADVAMAVRLLGQLEMEVRRRFDVRRSIVWHRLGSVPVGEPSVIIGTATPHRAEAFAATRYLIDELKTRVPIWKSSTSEGSRRPASSRSSSRRRSKPPRR